MRHILGLLALTACCGSVALHGQPARLTRTDAPEIRRLIRVTGAEDTARKIFNMSLDQMKRSDSGIPTNVWEAYRAEFSIEESINRIIPVFQMHFTPEDVQAISAFYASPLGKKLIQVLPVLQTEVGVVLQKYNEEVSLRVAKKTGFTGRR